MQGRIPPYLNHHLQLLWIGGSGCVGGPKLEDWNSEIRRRLNISSFYEWVFFYNTFSVVIIILLLLDKKGFKRLALPFFPLINVTPNMMRIFSLHHFPFKKSLTFMFRILMTFCCHIHFVYVLEQSKKVHWKTKILRPTTLENQLDINKAMHF